MTTTTTTTPTTPTPPWPTPLTEQLSDPEDVTTPSNDLTNQTDAAILHAVRQTNRLRLMCCTWNMHGEKAPSHADMQLLLSPGMHHLIMITTQECERTADKSILNPSKAAWEAALNVAFGEQYMLIRSHGLAAIHISLLCHRAIIPLISHIDSAAIATGLGSRRKGKKVQQEDEDGNVITLEQGGGGGLRLGNKGGVGIAICIGSTSILFVGAHLAAHKTKCDRRNQDFYDVDHGLMKKLQDLPAHVQKKEGGKRKENEDANVNNDATATDLDNKPNAEGKVLGASAKYDHVFWGGDFNYRINGTREAIDSLLAHQLHAVLYENDQLNIEMKRNAVFSNFQEGPLHFQPTYKYDPGTDVYDTSKKKRCPSWTDRILWRCNAQRSGAEQDPDIINTEYNSIEQLKMSDHRPVRACFHMNVRVQQQSTVGQDTLPVLGQQGHAGRGEKKVGEKKDDTTIGQQKEQPVQGIAENLLGIAKSQVCAIQ